MKIDFHDGRFAPDIEYFIMGNVMENKGKAIISFLILAQLFGVATYANPGETCEDPILISLGQAYWGSTDIAAGPGGVGNGNEEGLDVWHAFTPGLSGAYTVTLSSTSLAATFSILDACDGIDITCNNDLGDYSVQSQRTVFLETGKTYLIRVTDYAGVTGEYALFVMNPDGPVADGFETGGFSASPWQGQGTPWHITLDTYHTGSFSAQSGSVDDNEHATLTLTHICKAGDIRFAVKVSSERDHDT
ncbi:MAG: hypothetical protein GY809_06900, partial [Planctomycetes bacterium]|nr:hypothetical protein [Planctomycetota bacterium]